MQALIFNYEPIRLFHKNTYVSWINARILALSSKFLDSFLYVKKNFILKKVLVFVLVAVVYYILTQLILVVEIYIF